MNAAMKMNKTISFPQVNLGEYVSFKTGKLNSNAAKFDGKYPFFTCSQEIYLTDTYSFDAECVLLGGNNANGIYPIFYFKGKFDAYQRTYVIQSLKKTKLSNRYLFYALQLQLELLRSISTGVATKFLTLTILNDIEIPLPPLLTQQKIAAILSGYDDLIENNNRRIKILEEMAQAIYRDWFVDFRFPGHEGVRMVESELGLVPEGWEVVQVTDAATINPKITLPKEGIKPFLSMGCLSEGTMNVQTIEYREGNSGSKFQNGDTLFARITPCLENGKTVFVQFLPTDTAIAFGSTEFIVIRSKTLTPEFVYLLSRTDSFRDNAIKSMSGATGRQRVQEECFKKYFIAQPDGTTLKAFDEVIKPIFQSVFTLALKNANLRRTRDLLLPKLISGEFDVSELDILIPEEMAA
jgi:type I restriction enzyme S subunit